MVVGVRRVLGVTARIWMGEDRRRRGLLAVARKGSKTVQQQNKTRVGVEQLGLDLM